MAAAKPSASVAPRTISSGHPVDERIGGAERHGQAQAAEHQEAPVHVVGQPAARAGGDHERDGEERPRDADLPAGRPAGHEQQRPADVVDAGGQAEGRRRRSVAPVIDRVHRTLASLATVPSSLVRASRSAASSGGSTTRSAGTQATKATTPEPRNMIHMWWAPDDGPDQRTDGHAGDLGAVDRGEGPAAPLHGNGTRHHGQRGDGRRPGPRPCSPRSTMAMAGAMGARKAKLASRVDDESADQHRLAPDPVGEPAERVLEQDPGGEERGHDHAGQQVRAAEMADVDGQHGDDRRRPQPLAGRR